MNRSTITSFLSVFRLPQLCILYRLMRGTQEAIVLNTTFIDYVPGTLLDVLFLHLSSGLQRNLDKCLWKPSLRCFPQTLNLAWPRVSKPSVCLLNGTFHSCVWLWTLHHSSFPIESHIISLGWFLVLSSRSQFTPSLLLLPSIRPCVFSPWLLPWLWTHCVSLKVLIIFSVWSTPEWPVSPVWPGWRSFLGYRTFGFKTIVPSKLDSWSPSLLLSFKSKSEAGGTDWV